MTVVQVDVFSPDDPNGTPLGTIDSAEAEAIDWRVGIRGDPGEGHVLINREHSAAALIASDRIYKIKVPVIDSGYIHAFIQKDARYTLAHPKESGAESLDLYGPGLKALFSQARLLWQWYAPGQTARGSANYAHNLWKWVNEPYGAVAVRVIQEGINQPGTPLADMTLTFTRTLDSNGDPWANIAEEWQETVGTDVLSVLQRLEEAGDFYIEVLPDLTVNAYQSLPARDLTATVHIEKGVNLLTSLQRTLHGRAAITHLELEDSEGNYSLEVDPGWSSGERGSIGYYKAATNDDSTLNKIGQEVIRRSRSSLQPLQLEIDPLQLLPGPEGSANGDYWINCEVLLSSGTGPQDYDEETVLVTGLRFSLDKAVDDSTESTRRKSLRIVTECNVETTSSVDPKAGFGGPIGPHSHAEILCSEGDPGSSVALRYYFSSNTESALSPLTADAAWADGGSSVRKLKAAPDGTYTGLSQDIQVGVNVAVGNYIADQGKYAVQITGADLLAAVQAGGLALLAQIRCRARHGIGVNEASQNEIAQLVVRVYRTGGAGFIGTMLAAHAAASGTKFPAQSTLVNRRFSGTAAAVASAALNDWIVVEPGARHLGPTSGGSGAYWAPASVVGASDLPEDESTSSNLNSWVQLSQTGVGAVDPDLPLDTVRQDEEAVGSSRKVSRCDHQHAHGLLSTDGTNYHGLNHLSNYIFHAPAAPTATDDESDGYVVGTHWIDGSTGDVYILTDAAAGAAVWVILSAGGAAYTDEQAQDAVGAMIGDTATVDLTYTDATPLLKADVIPSGIKLDDLGAPDDNTDLDASTTKHGLLKKLPGGTATFLRADGTFAAPAGGGGGGTGVASANLFVGSVDPYEATHLTQPFVANSALFFKFCPAKDVTVSQVHFRVSTQSGNLDFGIYDDTLALLASTGSFACPAVPGGGINTQAFSGGATVLLEAGKVYFLAMVASSTGFRTTTKNPSGTGTVLSHGWKLRGAMAAALPLPTTATPTFDNSSVFFVPVFLFS